MASPSSKTQPGDCPEFAVRRETISSYFHPPLASSTFHDFVNKGKIIPMKGIRGFYKLNDSLRRLGLREVAELPQEAAARSADDLTLNAGDMNVQVQGLGAASTDVPVPLVIAGNSTAANHPVQIKSMKKRTVKVALHKVLGLGALSVQTKPRYMPTPEDLEIYLNKVYRPQVNVEFDVQIFTETGPNRPLPEEEGIDFDLNNNGKLPTESGAEYDAATPNSQVGKPGSTFNIDVWVVGGVNLTYLDENFSEYYCYGAHKPGTSRVIVDGDVMTNNTVIRREVPSGEEKKHLLHTIAHEIGHVMTNDSHPGEHDYLSSLHWNGGIDPYLQHRLMCSGPQQNRAIPGVCLIKKEWDRIEEWLKSEEARLGKSL